MDHNGQARHAEFSRLARSALAVLAAVTASAQPARTSGLFRLEWHQLEKGVWAGIRPISYDAPVVGSTLIVVGKKGVFVFDPAGFALQGERLVEKVRSITDRPVTHIAISHWHGDHSLGTHKVVEA